MENLRNLLYQKQWLGGGNADGSTSTTLGVSTTLGYDKPLTFIPDKVSIDRPLSSSSTAENVPSPDSVQPSKVTKFDHINYTHMRQVNSSF